MMRCLDRNRRGMRIVALLIVPVAGLLSGCRALFPTTPPPEAVLAGTWAMTAQNVPDLKQLLFTFDSNGNLQTIQYQVASNATITVPAPIGETSVSGTAVSISVAFNTNTLAFNGTLNSANNVIDGSLTTLIAVGSSVVTVDNGPATMTKQ